MSVLPGTEVEFTIEKEDWNIIELDDGTIIKMRTILTKIIRDPHAKPPPNVPPGVKGAGFTTTFHNIAVVHKANPGNMGKPTPLPVQKQDAESVEVGFTEYSSPFNVYVLKIDDLPKPFKLKVKLVVSNVIKYVDLYDQFGYPMYNVNSTNAVVPTPPKKRRKRKG